MDYTTLKDTLLQDSISFEENYPLYRLTSFKVGGKADFIIFPSNEKEVFKIFKIIREQKIPFFILGGGTNLLISDDGFRGVVIHAKFPEKYKILEENKNFVILKIFSCCANQYISNHCMQKGFKGLEFLATIPGSVGGAIVQNAGCYGSEISDFLLSCDVAMPDGTVEIFEKTKLKFKYRESFFKTNRLFIISASFKLFRDDPETIKSKIEMYKWKRFQSQPENKKSAGSVFKNILADGEIIPAWKLIDQSGFRGFRINDAMISSKHCNFIVNAGHAAAQDIYKLMQKVQQDVLEKTGHQLAPEIELVGKFK